MENSSSWLRTETKEEKDAPKSRQNVSFKFSKLTPKALSGNKLSGKNVDRETILSVENKEIQSSIPKEEKKKLVIPPLQKNVWRSTGADLRESKNDNDIPSNKSINDLAVEELLKESAVKNAKWESRETPNITIKIPMVIQNKLPEGFETDDKLDVTLRAEEPTLEDYENIPVNDFGSAVLRGFGCNPGDPMGNKNKKYVEPIEASLRSKGLGLGADKKMQKNSKVQADEELKLVAGAYIQVGQGSHKGSYGVLEGLDEARVIVRLNQLDKNISMPALYVDVISKKEFDKDRKTINKNSYDNYKDEYVLNNGRDSTEEETHRSHDSSKLKRKHSKHKESHKKHSMHQTEKSHDCWVRPLLKVRFIDNEYKKGKYFNEKMVVEDVVSLENCVCRTENGKYLDDIRPSMLETVIPRSDPSHVMVVKGKHKLQLGAILSRDKKECTATVQLLSDRTKVIVSDYDSICEYTGDPSQFD